MRKKSEESSEMVSQLLFGEQCDILDNYENNWLLVRSRKDAYRGWVDIKLIEPSLDPYDDLSNDLHYCVEPSYMLMAGEQSRLITFGATLPGFDGISFRLNGVKYCYSGQAARPGDFNLSEDLVEKLCKKYLNAPYLWGGKTVFGVDCSGFVQIIFRVLGVNLPRDAKDQVKEGLLVDFVSESMTGDLAFFTNSTNRISHVGIILNNGRIIHGSGKVRIDKLDHVGIFNTNENRYTHHLKIIRRML